MAGFFALQWHITNKCDQRCKHCYIFNSDSIIPKEEWDIVDAERLLKEFTAFCVKYKKRPSMAITGGDPILHPQFWEIIDLVHKHNIPFNILGNPFHLNPEVVNTLKSRGCQKYQVSLDGLPKTHDSMRKPGSFEATIEAIKLLKECELPPVVMTTVSRINYLEVPELTRMLVNLGVHTCAFARYCPTHNDTESNLSPYEYRAFLGTMWDVYSELADCGTKFTLKDHLWKAYLFEEGMLEAIPDDGVVYDGCHCGNSHLTFLENGEAYACRRMETPVGAFPKNSLEEIFFSEQMDNYRDIDQIDGCKDCELLCQCRGCRAVAFGTTGGDYFAKDPQCWRC